MIVKPFGARVNAAIRIEKQAGRRMLKFLDRRDGWEGSGN